MLFAALFLLVSSVAFAQNIQVKGVVTDASTGEPVSFAAVQVKGTSAGTATGMDGTYSGQHLFSVSSATRFRKSRWQAALRSM